MHQRTGRWWSSAGRGAAGVADCGRRNIECVKQLQSNPNACGRRADASFWTMEQRCECEQGWFEKDDDFFRMMIVRAMNCDWRHRHTDEAAMIELLTRFAPEEVHVSAACGVTR